MMLCMLKDQGTYLTLYQKISAHVPGIKVFLQGYASDGEMALRNALAQEFPHTIAFICTVHAKKNITERCNDLGLSKQLTSTVVCDIFGAGGLLFMKDRTSYDDKCRALMAKWDELECGEKVSPSFAKYFEKCKKEDLYEHMRAQLSVEAGFGDQLITTNPIEAINAVIKRWNNFQSTDMSNLLKELKDCIDEQQDNVRKAFFNLPSAYSVRPKFREHIVSNYFALSSAERKLAILKIGKIKVDPKRFQEVMRYKCRSSTAQLLVSDHEDVGENEELLTCPAPSPFDVLLSVFTRSDIDNLQKKATKIVDNKQILKGFTDNEFIVKSNTDKYRTVKILGDWKIKCEKECIGYESRNLCTHTIAAALVSDSLDTYLRHYVKENRVNLTQLSVTSVNPNAGRKSVARKRIRSKSRDVVKQTMPVSTSVVRLGMLFLVKKWR